MSFFQIRGQDDPEISQSLLGIENEEEQNDRNSTRMTELSSEEDRGMFLHSDQFLTLLNNLKSMEKEIHEMREHLEKRMNTSKKRVHDEDQVGIDFLPNGSHINRYSIQGDAHSPRKRTSSQKQWIGPKLQHYLFFISFGWQVLNVILIAIIEHFFGEKETKSQQMRMYAGIGVMLGFQLIHVLAVIITSVKLTKQVLHRTARPIFVFQSYLSTIVLFTGVYTLVYRITTSSFNGIHQSGDGTVPILILFVNFLYFSVCTMSGVGYGDIVPGTWYSQLVVIFQMFLAVVFTVIIFAQGLHHFNKDEMEIKPGKNETTSPSKSKISTFFSRFK
eukprot:TRINITY_DN2672_c0_g3_i1.p1 TRINITY_DN2672_c0_g3~~TRINITY_DN2672_c0_g3_i1.p1  ORF type:complete len:332 (+),score=44.81 TRINITY_DN2672_c0_g3_i1:883-1878(+)